VRCIINEQGQLGCTLSRTHLIHPFTSCSYCMPVNSVSPAENTWMGVDYINVKNTQIYSEYIRIY